MGTENTNYPNPPHSVGASMYSAIAPPISPPGSVASPSEYGYPDGPPQPPPPLPPQVPNRPQRFPAPPPNQVGGDLHPPSPAKPSSPVKPIVGIITSLVSTIVISLTYATFLRPAQIIPNPEGPLATTVIFSSVALLSAIWIYTLSRKLAILGGLVPVVLATLAGTLLILYYAAIQSYKNRNGLLIIDYTAVLISAAVFGGMSFGSMITYLIFAQISD